MWHAPRGRCSSWPPTWHSSHNTHPSPLPQPCNPNHRFVMHSKKTAFIVEHDFIMAAYLADRVVVYEGQPARDATARSPQSLLTGGWWVGWDRGIGGLLGGWASPPGTPHPAQPAVAAHGWVVADWDSRCSRVGCGWDGVGRLHTVLVARVAGSAPPHPSSFLKLPHPPTHPPAFRPCCQA